MVSRNNGDHLLSSHDFTLHFINIAPINNKLLLNKETRVKPQTDDDHDSFYVSYTNDNLKNVYAQILEIP